MKTMFHRNLAGRGSGAALAALLCAASANAQLMNRMEPLPGLTTSGQPDEAALEEIAGEGYTAVIDLRGPEEDRGLDEAQAVEALGMSYIPLPVAGLEEISYPNANALDEILKDIEGPVLVHCGSGNRVGALLALRARLTGASVEDAMALGEAGGMTRAELQDAVEEKLHQRE